MERWRIIRPMHTLLVLFALLALPACAESQTSGMSAARTEAARVERALADIEARALRDPELLRLNEELGQSLMSAMVRADPGLADAAVRMTGLRERRAAAVRTGDASAVALADREIGEIQARYVRAQAAALNQPTLADRIDRFNALLRRRMIETDGAAAQLLERYAELTRLLNP